MNIEGLAALHNGPRPLPLFLEMLREQTAAFPDRHAAALAGLKRYQTAIRAEPPPPLPVVAQARRACLIDYGGDGPPLVVVPSLINPPFVLDLQERSLLRWLARQGVRPLLVDWGTPDPAERDLDIGGHVERSLLPLIATPWRFAGFGDDARADIAALWARAQPQCDALGLVPMEVLQAGFWQLDPRRTIAKYEAFAAMARDSDEARAFVALEDWANAGAPLTYAAGAELFGFFADDAPGSGQWRVGGRVIDPLAQRCPIADFVSLSDRIVPAASASGAGRRHGLSTGHVGMIVGRAARAQLWEPLATFLRAAAAAGTQ